MCDLSRIHPGHVCCFGNEQDTLNMGRWPVACLPGLRCIKQGQWHIESGQGVQSRAGCVQGGQDTSKGIGTC